MLQDMRARWPGEHKAAASLQARLTDAVGGDADLRQLAADAFRGYDRRSLTLPTLRLLPLACPFAVDRKCGGPLRPGIVCSLQLMGMLRHAQVHACVRDAPCISQGRVSREAPASGARRAQLLPQVRTLKAAKAPQRARSKNACAGGAQDKFTASVDATHRPVTLALIVLGQGFAMLSSAVFASDRQRQLVDSITDICTMLRSHMHWYRCREAPSLFGKSSSKQAKDGRAEQHRTGGAKRQLKRRLKPAKIAKRVFR